MTNPVWQPGPPQEPGWFWVEYMLPDSDSGYPRKTVSIFRFYPVWHASLWCDSINFREIIRHAGPVAIPEPVEPDSNRQPEPAGPCDVDGGFYVGVK